MKNKKFRFNKLLLCIYLFALMHVCRVGNAQTLSPSVICTNGGYYVGGGNSLSWTIGETFNSTLQNGDIILTQGEQQPYIILKLLNLKAFIQGFYTGGREMTATLHNIYPLVYPSNVCDTINVELHYSFPPFNVVASKKVLLLTNGNAEILFPKAILNDSYYIVVNHRNSIETWSKFPVDFTEAVVNFDFTSY